MRIVEAAANRRLNRVLIDGAQAFNRHGTGIASYGRTLAKTVHELGAEIVLLLGREARSRKHDPANVFASQVFGGGSNPSLCERFIRAAMTASAAYLPSGLRLDAQRVDTYGIDLKTFDPPLPAADHFLNADAVYARASFACGARCRLTEVRVPDPIDIAHWTGPLPAKVRSVPNIYTIHDLVPLQYPHFVLDQGGRSARIHAAIAREADLIVTVSEFSKQAIVDILDVSPDRVAVTYQPVPPLLSLSWEDAARIVRDIFGVQAKEYSLFIGAIEPKKNVRRMIDAHLMASIQIPLLLVGPLGWMFEDDQKLIQTINLNRRNGGVQQNGGVQHLGYLPRRLLSALLQCARYLVFPSICEGFGLPVLEAMQAGVPVVTSNTTSLPEIAGDAAVLVDPLDVNDIARGIRLLANNEGLRQDLSDRGRVQASRFSEGVYMQRLREAYAKVGVRFENRASDDLDEPVGRANVSWKPAP